jgi:hypothetical protein
MQPTSDLAIEATGVVKTFGTTRAVNGVDLVVPAGGVYGLRKMMMSASWVASGASCTAIGAHRRPT